MKRLWIALSLFALVGGLCAFSVLYQQRQIGSLLEKLDELEVAYIQKDSEESRQLAMALQQEYDRCTALFPCFISHDDLADSRGTVATLSASLKEDNPEEFLIETARLRAQLEWLLEVDSPTWKNVL